MTREELLQALRRIKVNTGSLTCLGCGHEHGCSVHGCAVINAAVREINLLAAERDGLRDRCSVLQEARDAARRAAMTPQRAADILQNANLGGELRLAADVGIEALEREMGGIYPLFRCAYQYVQNLIDWVCLSEQIKENNNTICNLTG